MATKKAATFKAIPAIKELTVSVRATRGQPNLQQIHAQVEKALGRLGCPGCLSGLNRLIIEDPVARGIR